MVVRKYPVRARFAPASYPVRNRVGNLHNQTDIVTVFHCRLLVLTFVQIRFLTA